MNARTDRFPLVDSLRAIAALAVVGTHVAFFAGAYDGGSAVGPYAQRLDVGVTVFFLISGFLLYRPFVKARLTEIPQPATGPYAWRRFLRIVPAYWVALTVSVVWLGTDGVFTATGIPTFYGLGQTYRESTIGGGLTQAWTLTIEVAFYTFLPLWAALQRAVPARDMTARFRTEWVGLAVLFVVGQAWKLVVLAHGDPHQVHITPTLIAFPAYLDDFAVGMGLAVLSVRTELTRSVPRPLELLERFPSLPWVVSAVAFWAVSTQIGLDRRFFSPVSSGQYLRREWLYLVVALGLILPAVTGDPRRGVARHVLALRWLAWLGLISYGIYLWHETVLTQLSRWDFGSVDVVHPYVQWAVAGIAGTVVIAAASYYLVERPALRLKRLVGPRDPGPPGEAITEPAPAAAPATRAG